MSLGQRLPMDAAVINEAILNQATKKQNDAPSSWCLLGFLWWSLVGALQKRGMRGWWAAAYPQISGLTPIHGGSKTLGQTLTWGTWAAQVKSVHCRSMRNVPRNFTSGLFWLFQGLQLHLQFLFTLQTFTFKKNQVFFSFFLALMYLKYVSDIFLLPRRDILTWAYKGRNLEYRFLQELWSKRSWK